MRLRYDVIITSLILPSIVIQAEVLTGGGVRDVASAKKAVQQLLARGPGCVVLTLGAGGVVFSGWGSESDESITHLPAESVEAIDSTVSPPPPPTHCGCS